MPIIIPITIYGLIAFTLSASFLNREKNAVTHVIFALLSIAFYVAILVACSAYIVEHGAMTQPEATELAGLADSLSFGFVSFIVSPVVSLSLAKISTALLSIDGSNSAPIELDNYNDNPHNIPPYGLISDDTFLEAKNNEISIMKIHEMIIDAANKYHINSKIPQYRIGIDAKSNDEYQDNTNSQCIEINTFNKIGITHDSIEHDRLKIIIANSTENSIPILTEVGKAINIWIINKKCGELYFKKIATEFYTYCYHAAESKNLDGIRLHIQSIIGLSEYPNQSEIKALSELVIETFLIENN